MDNKIILAILFYYYYYLPAPQGGEEDRDDAEDGPIYRPSDAELRNKSKAQPILF